MPVDDWRFELSGLATVNRQLAANFTDIICELLLKSLSKCGFRDWNRITALPVCRASHLKIGQEPHPYFVRDDFKRLISCIPTVPTRQQFKYISPCPPYDCYTPNNLHLYPWRCMTSAVLVYCKTHELLTVESVLLCFV